MGLLSPISDGESPRVETLTPTAQLLNSTTLFLNKVEAEGKDASPSVETKQLFERKATPDRHSRKGSILRQPDPEDHLKKRKSVTFNLGMNEVTEIERQESITSPSSDEDDAMMKNASNVAEEDSDDSDDGSQDNSQVGRKKRDSIAVVQGKQLLEKEMEQLRDEYKRRRDEYYQELDSIQLQMERKRTRYKTELEEYQDIIKMNERMDRIDTEMTEVEEKEKILEKRRESCTLKMKELEDLDAYYSRRQKGINEKEEDLFTLQDELESLAVDLRKREKDLKQKQKYLDDLDQELKRCTHDEEEIKRTNMLLEVSQKDLQVMKTKLDSRTEELDKTVEKLKTAESEKGHLEKRVKSLENQLSLSLKMTERPLSSSSHYEQRASLRHVGGEDPLAAGFLSPKLHKRSMSLSPTSPTLPSPSLFPRHEVTPANQKKIRDLRRATSPEITGIPVQIVAPLHRQLSSPPKSPRLTPPAELRIDADQASETSEMELGSISPRSKDSPPPRPSPRKIRFSETEEIPDAWESRDKNRSRTCHIM